MTSLPATARAGRLGLYGPLVALAIAVAGWSLGWLWLRAETAREIDAIALSQARGGGGLAWSGRRVYGYPFRIDVDFTDVSWRQPTGWTVFVPTLKTEAFVFSPTHWVAAAPDGVVLERPLGAPVRIAAKVLRASLSHPEANPPTFSLEGLELTFTPADHGAPYILEAARAIHLHSVAGPADQGALLIQIDSATLAPTGLLGRVSAGKPMSISTEAIYSHASALAGATWAGAVRAWAAAGGKVDITRLRLQSGPAVLQGQGQGLTVDGDGRLDGAVDAILANGPQALAALAMGAPERNLGGVAATLLEALPDQGPVRLTLGFSAGHVRLGPMPIGPAPKVY